MTRSRRPPVTRAHSMAFGAELQADGSVRFRLWAPRHERIGLRIQGQQQTLWLQPESDGWHSLLTPQATGGSRYQFVLPDGMAVPDPASRFQPEDVHGASEVIDPRSYHWRDFDWHGRPWHEAVLYELHLGCFTSAGSYLSARDRLPDLQRLGVTAIELMPLADFPGGRNWGYDGALLFAPDASYGEPQQLKALIDAAHALGIMVVLDVVYNHFGPEGNYLAQYAPQFFSAQHHTPWGAAVNFDGPGSGPVREFFIHNALYWLEEYHFDGLRFDAVHAILDDSPRHFLTELAHSVRRSLPGRQIHLILENEHNQVRWLERDAVRESQLYDAQWNDDAHHVLHAAVSGDNEGYYADYLGQTERLARALAQGFAFQGDWMPYRQAARGEPCAHLPPTAFIAFLQNHDQVGNRAFGERLNALAPYAAVRAVTALYLLLPQIPMLFMGEEWHSQQPFLFFCDFAGELGEAVARGRRQEFARFAAFRDEAVRARIPDPQAPETFHRSKLDWEDLGRPESGAVWAWYRELLAVRQRHIVPLLPELTAGGDYRVLGASTLRVHWRSAGGAELTLRANLKADAAAPHPHAVGRLLWQEGHCDASGMMGPWTVRWTLRV